MFNEVLREKDNNTKKCVKDRIGHCSYSKKGPGEKLVGVGLWIKKVKRRKRERERITNVDLLRRESCQGRAVPKRSLPKTAQSVD